MKYRDLTDYIDYFSDLTNDFFEPPRKEDAFFCVRYSAPVEDFIQKIYRHLDALPKERYVDYRDDPAVRKYLTEGATVAATMTEGEIIHFLTYFVRGERFCTGHIADLCRRGFVSPVLCRLKEIDEGKA